MLELWMWPEEMSLECIYPAKRDKIGHVMWWVLSRVNLKISSDLGHPGQLSAVHTLSFSPSPLDT